MTRVASHHYHAHRSGMGAIEHEHLVNTGRPHHHPTDGLLVSSDSLPRPGVIESDQPRMIRVPGMARSTDPNVTAVARELVQERRRRNP